MNWWSNDPVVEDEPKAGQGDWWKSDPVIGEELSDTNPPVASELTGPHYVPAEMQQFAEQAAIEQKPYWPTPTLPSEHSQNLSDLMSGRYGRDVQIPKHIHVPTMAETGAIPAEAFKAYLTYANPVGLGVVAAEKIWPEAPLPKIAKGAIAGTSEALAGFTTPENLASLAVMPQSKIAQALLNLGLGGMAATQLPDQIKAYGATDDPEEKAKIATGIGVSIGLPALGAAHSFRKPRKVVEPVRTTQETPRAAPELERQGTTEVPQAPDSSGLSRPEAVLPLAEARVEPVPDVPRTPIRSQPESISTAVEEARPKIPNEDIDTALALLKDRPEASELYSGISIAKANLNAIKARIEAAPDAEKSRLQLVQNEAETRLSRVVNEVLGRKEQPIQPGVESALAEIQRRNAPAEVQRKSVPEDLQQVAPVPSEPLPAGALVEEIGSRQKAVSSSQPESTATSTKNATIFAEPGVSKIGKSIEAKAVEAKLTQGFEGTANFDPITIKDQARRATGLIKSSLDNARAVIRGEAPLPEGLRGTSLITAMEEHITRQPNAELAYELANSPLVRATSEAAQEMRLMAERVPDSITSAFQEIREARRAGSKQRGETPERVVQEIKAEVVRNSSKRPTWEAFVRSIECPV